MRDFTYYAPTEVVLGAESERQTAALIRKYGGTKVLLHYGGRSAERSGLLALLRENLAAEGLSFVELGGVVPNPHLSLVRQGVELCKRENVDFILAVGGGSVIDSAKAIAYGIYYEGDIWELFMGRGKVSKACPLGTVLTIPAAGSEMSQSCVISNEELGMKRGYSNNLSRCKFAIMNPERTYTLPAYQTACGVTDIMMHTMERYFGTDYDVMLTDAIAEALLRTVKDCGEQLLTDPNNYLLRSQIMWASSLSHNDLTGCGTVFDFATHRLEHELSALFDVAHGAGLAAMWCHWAQYVMSTNVERFEKFAKNVMGVASEVPAEEAAREGIEKMREYFRLIGMPTTIPELLGRPATEEEILVMIDHCSLGKTITVGTFKTLNYEDMVAIYHNANR